MQEPKSSAKKSKASEGKDGKEVKAPKKRKSKSADAELPTIESEWARLMGASTASPKAYSPKTQFLLGDKIDHKEFGSGVVSKIIYPNKMEVYFQTTVKLLIQASHRVAGPAN